MLVTAEAISATEIMVTWTQPSFSVNSYVLTANDITVTPLAADLEFTITGAAPFTDYTINIVGLTNNGLSLPSNTLFVRTLESGKLHSLYRVYEVGNYRFCCC